MVLNSSSGETVVVQSREAKSTDSFGKPTYTFCETEVLHVLVSPGSRSDLADPSRPDGHLVRYTLHFPKSFVDSLENCRIKVRGSWYQVIGLPDHYDHALTPGAWSMPVEVIDVHG
jgi:hypothetical protein